MDKAKYSKLLTEVFRHITESNMLEDALSYRRSAERIDAVQDLIRKAIVKSSISYYNDQPYYFNGRIYEPIDWDDFGRMIDDLIRRCGLPYGDHSRVDGIIRVCKRAIHGKRLNPDNGLVVFTNGVYDVRTGKLHKFSKRLVQVTEMSYDYNPDEYPDYWHNFLDVVLPNHSIQKVLQEFLGAIFINRDEVKIEKMLLLLGSGSNGKSVIYETILGLLGKDNVTPLSPSELMSGADVKKNLVFINGKRLNYCSEINTDGFGSNLDNLKKIISGETIVGRELYKGNQSMRNFPLMMANANRLPYLRDWSHGFRRKIVIIPFNVTIPPEMQDKTLARKLRNDYPGIFNWIMEGMRRFIDNGYELTQLQALESLADDFQAQSSPILQFMRDMDYNRAIVEKIIEPRYLQAEPLYHAYVKWCIERAINYETIAKFGRVLWEAQFTKAQIRGKNCYVVYSLRDSEDRQIKKIEIKKEKIDSTGIIRGAIGLSAYLKISRHVIAKLLQKGVLEGCYRREGTRYLFMAKESKSAVTKYLRNDKNRREIEREPDEVKQMRRKFNERMRILNQPFRKFLHKPNNSTGNIIYVVDEFDYKRDKNNWEQFIKEYK